MGYAHSHGHIEPQRPTKSLFSANSKNIFDHVWFTSHADYHLALTIQHDILQGESRADLHTITGASRLDNIRTLYGGSVARNMVEFRANISPKSDTSPFKEAAIGVDEDMDLGELEFEAKVTMSACWLLRRQSEAEFKIKIQSLTYHTH